MEPNIQLGLACINVMMWSGENPTICIVFVLVSCVEVIAVRNFGSASCWCLCECDDVVVVEVPA